MTAATTGAKAKANSPRRGPPEKSDDPNTRLIACNYLGDLGSRKHVRRMKKIAKSDPTYKIVRRVKVYWVRDGCLKAIERLKTRR